LRHSLRTDQSTPGHTTASILGDPLYVKSRLWDLVEQFSGFVFGREGVRLTVGYTGRCAKSNKIHVPRSTYNFESWDLSYNAIFVISVNNNIRTIID
jgi:hypothetical protein